MSVIYQIPHTAKFLSPTCQFTANFNAPTLGKYDFGTAANKNVQLMKLAPGVAYLIDRITWAASLGSEQWTGALSSAGAPQISIKKQQSKAPVFPLPYSLSVYSSDAPFAAWVNADNGGDSLIVSMTGVINQIASMVGIASVNVSVSLAVYAIEGSTDFNIAYRGPLSPNAGQQVRGGI